jgi:hypothetical protein
MDESRTLVELTDELRVRQFEEKWATLTDKAKDARARRAAEREGLIARKSRWRRDSVDNYGQFMLVDSRHNLPVAGFRYDMSAEEVMDYCKEDAS